MSFNPHSRLITMALDHFRTFCWPIESSAGPTLHQHPPPAPQQPLASPAAAAVTQNEWSRLRNVHTKAGMSFCSALTPQTNGYVRAHTEEPHKSGHVQTQGVETLIMTSI